MKLHFCICLVLALVSQSSLAETVYVDDKIKIWSRSGPSNNHRVLHRFAPGTPLDKLQQDNEAGFTEVRDPQGRVSWIKSDLLTNQPTSHHKLDNALKQISQLKSVHATKVASLEKQLQDLLPLETFNQDLQNRLASQESELEQLRQKSQVYQSGFQSEAFFAGAVVVLGGMLFGWILTKLGGRRRQSGWS